MAFHIHDPETDRLARELARVQNVGLTQAVRSAIAHELERMRKPAELATAANMNEQMEAFWARHAIEPASESVPKAFIDELWETE